MIDISVKYIAALKPENSIDQLAVLYLEDLADDDTYKSEPGVAKEFYDSLENFYRQNESLIKKYPDIHDRYRLILGRLLWKSLLCLPNQIRQTALSRNLVFYLKNDITIKDSLTRFFSPYEFGSEPYNGRNQFIDSLEKSNEQLGSHMINVKGSGQSAPAIANWIKDYNTYTLNPEHDAYRQIDYINNNENVKKLSRDEQEVLKKIISLYDWLKYPQVAQNKIGDRKISPQAALIGKTPITPPEPSIKPLVINKKPTRQPIGVSSNLREDLEELKQTTQGRQEPELHSGSIKAKPASNSPVSTHSLEDMLERLQLRAEAGLEIPENEANDIVELIKRKKNQK